MSFELIAAEEAHFPKALMCRALDLVRLERKKAKEQRKTQRNADRAADVVSPNETDPAERGE